MAKFERFEDIEAWKKARVLVKEIYRISENDKFSRDFALKEQIRKSAISVVSNIAEGFARKTNKEFIQFLYISHGSLAEIEAQLFIALDLGYIQKERFDSFYNECYNISKMIMGLIKYLSSKNPPTHRPINSSTSRQES
jgi:four helix bundle protein